MKEVDFPERKYGEYPLCCSAFQTQRKWIGLGLLDEGYEGQDVLVRGRVLKVRAKGNSVFVALREGMNTLQACAFKSDFIPKEMVRYISLTPHESIVDLYGKIVKPQKSISSCTQPVQLLIERFFIVNKAIDRLPLQIADASRPEIDEFSQLKRNQLKQANLKQNQSESESQQKKIKNKEGNKEYNKDWIDYPRVSMKSRLDNRVIDLRTPAKQAIFKVSSGICQLFRQFCLDHDFVQIHTPKLIGGTSEGGCEVFKLNYFNRAACLAQSPQLYKQMCVMADFQRVFEIGPVFRAEHAFSHRHMCEFMGLDLEMTIKQHYFQLLDLFASMFPYIFNRIEQRYSKELKVINEQFHCPPFICKLPVLRLTFAEGLELLRQNGFELPPFSDLSTEMEKRLGDIVRKKYETDFYMLYRYPASARPFYTMPCHDDPNYTCSYDFFMRGQQILSGAQRIHDPDLLTQKALQKGVNVQTIRDYIDSFRYGAYPHGGGGIGLQRVVMLYCGLKNIRNASLFPRDPTRLTP